MLQLKDICINLYSQRKLETLGHRFLTLVQFDSSQESNIIYGDSF